MSDNITTISPSEVPVTDSTESPAAVPATPLPTESPSALPSAEITASTLSPTLNGTEGQADNKGDDCDCSSCSTTANSTETKSLLIVTPRELEPFLRYHVAGYPSSFGVQIQLEVIDPSEDATTTTTTQNPFRTLQQRLLSGDDWDGAIFPSQLLGSLNDDLWELDEYLSTNTQSSNLLPFFQKHAMYGNVTKAMPLDGNIARMLYRKDLLEQHNLQVPRTWDEYQQVAQYFDQNTPGTKGSCISACSLHHNADRAFLVLSTMTQTMGTSSGFLLDPMTSQPDWGDAMEETLRLFQQHNVEEDCQGGGFARGECALTYTWDSHVILSNLQGLDVGVAPTPGSLRVMDSVTGRLEDCTPYLCPFGEYYPDIGIVNRAPYVAIGDWASGVSNSTSSQSETADFFAYLQSQSFPDILPNERTNQLDPYQYEHTQAYRWINEGGIAPTVAEGFSQSSLAVNSLNAVLNLKVPDADAFFTIFDEEIASYLADVNAQPNLEFQESIKLREQVTTRMTAKVENLIKGQPEFTSMYRDSVGFSTAPTEAFNYIDEDYRTVAWGMSGLIVFASIALIFWTMLFRKNPVMRAFQPFLLIQCAVGVLLMGGTIILLGLDDQMYDKDVLDFTCMAVPWAYVIGFTIFFSSVYCKIEECAKIFRDPQNHKVLFVSVAADAQFTGRLLILNGAILAAWSVSDPLRWVRQELDGGMIFPDGTVETYGMCRGAEFTSFAFASTLYFLNMIMLGIAIVRALKCRFLVMEYHELQWLTLSLIPFLEMWMIGASVLAISRDDPTVVFSCLAFVISVSSATAGLAIFAPKDWYVRKHKYMETRSRKENEHTSDSGILLLQHPKFENQKQLDHLQMQLQETLAHNTELEIEIRGMQERFREIAHLNDHYVQSQRNIRALASPRNSRISHSRGSGVSKIARPEQAPEPEPQWTMPDDEDETEVDLADADIAGPLETFSPLKDGQPESSKQVSNGVQTPPRKNGSKSGGGDELGNLVQNDDVEAIGNEADKMAKNFKATAGRALIGDGVGGVRVMTNDGMQDHQPPSEYASAGKKQSARDDETEELVLESTRESVGAYSMFHYNGYEPSRTHMYTSSQKPGEPSGDDSYSKKEEEKQRSQAPIPLSAPKETTPSVPAPSSQDIAKKAIAFRTDTQDEESGPPTGTYNMGEWSAVGGTGGVLADLSDASSYSSNSLSQTSMEATTRASALDTPFAKEVDQLVAKKDWDGLQLAAKSYNPTANAAASSRSSESSIDEKKRRKRELEASFARSRSNSQDEDNTQWA